MERQKKNSEVMPEWAAKKLGLTVEKKPTLEDENGIKPVPGNDVAAAQSVQDAGSEQPQAPEGDQPSETDTITDDEGAESSMDLASAISSIVGASPDDLEQLKSDIEEKSKNGEAPFDDPETAKKARSIIKYLQK